jgi:acyl transferase domain-containing protein
MATHQNDHDIPIAVVGMGCRFPGGSTSPEKFWDLLSKGRSAWSKVPAKRFNQEAFYHPATETPGAVRPNSSLLKLNLSLLTIWLRCPV